PLAPTRFVGIFSAQHQRGRPVMLAIHEHATVEEAGRELLPFILDAKNWIVLERLREDRGARPGENAEYQRRVGPLRICASVDVTPRLDVFLRVGFRAPGLSPMK